MTDLPTDTTPLVLHGNVLETLRSLPAGAFHCSVFSPPFWGLRRYDVCGCAQDYDRGGGEHPMPRLADGPIGSKKPDPNCRWCSGTGLIPGMDTLWGGDPSCEHEWFGTPPRRPRSSDDEGNLPSAGNFDAKGGKLCALCGGWFGSLGLEPTPQLYVDHMVMVFSALRRVMRDDGTIWCEIGDTYLTHPAGLTGVKRWKQSGLNNRDQSGAEQAGSIDKRQSSVREGNLALVPHRVAIALQERGWIVRQDNPWARPNPMPESVKNRSTRCHSYVFQIAKEPGYFYDQENGREPLSEASFKRLGQSGFAEQTGGPKDYGRGTNPNRSSRRAVENLKASGSARRNMLSVWRIPTHAFPGKHYATFPLRIPEICIGIGTSDLGCCPDCGAPFRRITSAGEPDLEWQRSAGGDANGGYDGESEKAVEGNGAQDPSEVKRRVLAGMVPRITIGWAPTCDHYPDPCDRCGKPWDHGTARRRVSTMNIRVRDAKKGVLDQKSGLGGETATASDKEVESYGDEGYKWVETDVSWPGCSCRPPVPALVLDPFAGSGTTLLKAMRMGRRSVGIELSPFYVDMARGRLAEEGA